MGLLVVEGRREEGRGPRNARRTPRTTRRRASESSDPQTTIADLPHHVGCDACYTPSHSFPVVPSIDSAEDVPIPRHLPLHSLLPPRTVPSHPQKRAILRDRRRLQSVCTRQEDRWVPVACAPKCGRDQR